MAHVDLRVDPALAEEVVFHAVRTRGAWTPTAASAYEAQRAALYQASLTPEERDAAFERMALHAFEAMGLTEVFQQRFAELPLLAGTIDLAIVRRVWTRKEERVELFVRERPAPLTSVLIAIQALRCLDRPRLVGFLRRELLHVSDMCDPAFAYSPIQELGGSCQTDNDLIRDRFRVLWDAMVEARMRRWGWVASDDGDPASSSQAPPEALAQREAWTQSALLALARSASHGR